MGVQEVGGAAEQGKRTERGAGTTAAPPRGGGDKHLLKLGPPRAAVPLMLVMSLLLPKWHNSSK